jgi:hypothetical protein
MGCDDRFVNFFHECGGVARVKPIPTCGAQQLTQIRHRGALEHYDVVAWFDGWNGRVRQSLMHHHEAVYVEPLTFVWSEHYALLSVVST